MHARYSETVTKYLIVALYYVYGWIVTVSLFSLTPPYLLFQQLLLYIAIGAFLIVALLLEINRSLAIHPNAVAYYRTLTSTVLVALVSSVFSGYHSAGAVYEYNVKTHLFLYMPNVFVFVVKVPYIVTPPMVWYAWLSSMLFTLAYMATLAVFFSD